jgi:hypothetical protein
MSGSGDDSMGLLLAAQRATSEASCPDFNNILERHCIAQGCYIRLAAQV